MPWYWISFIVIVIVSFIKFLILRKGFLKSLSSRHYLLSESSTSIDSKIIFVTWIYFFTLLIVTIAAGLGLYAYFL